MDSEKTKSKILTPEELKTRRLERSGISIPRLEAPKPFPTLTEIRSHKDPTPPQGTLRLPLSHLGTTDQRNTPTGPHFSGLIRRRPRKQSDG
ncbi:MAG: hypothetical protein ACK5QT_08190 [Oligoflexia bacterium]